MVLIDCLYRYGVKCGIGFVIKCDGGFERAVRFDTEQGVIISPSRQVERNGVPLQVARIEFTDEGADWLVFGERKRGGRI